MAGDNDRENLVLLTAREHYICHLLLIRMVEGKYKSKLAFAFHMISWTGNDNQQRYNSRLFEVHKLIANSNLSGKNNHMFGRKHSIQTKEKISLANKGKTRAPFSQKTRNRMSKAQIGKRASDETKRKLSLAKLGISLSDQHKSSLKRASTEAWNSKNLRLEQSKRLKEHWKNNPNQGLGIKQEIVKCSKCNKKGGIRATKRYHFDNCKN